MRRPFGLIAALALAAPTAADPGPAAWWAPATPFRIVGNISYVGTQGLAAYLFVSNGGDILLDGTLAENAPLIEANLRTLGVPLRNVRLLINSHAHYDHAAGLAQLKRDTGARLAAGAPDVATLESGHSVVANINHRPDMPPVRVDRVIHDGETVRVGGTALTAVLTPGHTPGCTSWTTRAREGRRWLRVIFPCSLSVAGNVLIGNAGYPGIVSDYRRSFARLATLKADVVLPAHPELAAVLDRAARQKRGERNAFVDPGLLPRIVGDARAAFATELARQQSGLPPS